MITWWIGLDVSVCTIYAWSIAGVLVPTQDDVVHTLCLTTWSTWQRKNIDLCARTLRVAHGCSERATFAIVFCVATRSSGKPKEAMTNPPKSMDIHVLFLKYTAAIVCSILSSRVGVKCLARDRTDCSDKMLRGVLVIITILVDELVICTVRKNIRV